MNTIYLSAAPLLLLACAPLFAWMISGQRLRTLCPSAADLLVLPFVGRYLLMLLVPAWVYRCIEFLAPCYEGKFGERHSSPQLPRRPHHSAT